MYFYTGNDDEKNDSSKAEINKKIDSNFGVEFESENNYTNGDVDKIFRFDDYSSNNNNNNNFKSSYQLGGVSGGNGSPSLNYSTAKKGVSKGWAIATIVLTILLILSCGATAIVGYYFVLNKPTLSTTDPDQIAYVVQNNTINSVVKIEAINANGTTGSAGTGFFIYTSANKSYVLTNYHVVESSMQSVGSSSANQVGQIWVSGVNLSEQNASFVVGTKSGDMAILEISGITNFVVPSVKFGNSDLVDYGHSVVAIGNPFGNGICVSQGIVSNPSMVVSNSDGYQFNVLQTDAVINFGNSGGPLFNKDCELIGINTLKQTDSGIRIEGKDENFVAEGIAFSVKVDEIKKFVNSISNLPFKISTNGGYAIAK